MSSNYGLGQYGLGQYGRYDPDPVVPGVQTPRPPADVRVRAYDPNGDTVGILPTPTGISAQFALNDVGALSMDYPLAGPRSSLLGRPLELAVEVTWDGGQTWNEPPSGRFQYLRDEGDGTKPQEGFKVAALGYVKRLEKALVGSAGVDAEGRVAYVQQTPGAILADLWDRAVSRGVLVGMTRTWTATQDSNGTPWPELQSIAYDPGANLLAVITAMAEQGWLDFRTTGRSVQVYVADTQGGMGQDQTLGALPVTLRYGRDLTEAPFRRTWEALSDTVLVQGDGGKFVTRTNPAAITPWGRQESYATASGVTDDGTLNAIGDAALTFTEKERVEHTLGLEFATTPHLPFRDYLPGHWVYAAVDSTVAPVRMRLRAVTITRDEAGNIGGNVTLNDKFLEADILQNRRITKLTAGAVQAGTGGAPSGAGNDILAPAKPTGLATASAAYVEADGRVRAQISVNWNDVTTNADGSPATDVSHYEVWARVPGRGDWYEVAQTTVSEWFNSPYEPGVTWEFRVRAVDTVYNRGAFSDTATVTTQADMTPPPTPSTPTGTTRLGTARITWDGLTATGSDMGATVPDFRYVDVHVSQVNGFTPSAATRVGELSAPGYVVAGPLNYQATYYARLVAYDSSGNASGPSGQVELVVAPLVDVSNFPDDAMEVLYARTAHFIDVTADMILANAVKTMHIEAGAVTTEKLTVGSRAQTILRNSFMEEADALDKPLHWGVIWGWDNANATGELSAPITGTRSLRINCTTTGGGIIVGDNAVHFPVVAGQKFYARATVRAVSATTRDVRLSGRSYNSGAGAGNPYSIFDANQSTTLLDVNGSATWAAGETRVLEGTWTIPANHTLGNVGIDLGDGNVGDAFIIDSIECWNAVTDSQVTEVSAGKIVTGVIQATQRIVAGSLTGARAELNGVGFQAYNPSGVKMFEVQANSGDTYVGDSAGIHMMLGAYANWWNGNVSSAMLKFRNPGWGEGQLFAQYWTDAGRSYGALRLQSPYQGDPFAQAAYLDLRNRDDGYSSFYLRASEGNMTADTFIMGSGATTVDFRVFGGPGFTFSDYSMTSRLNLYPNLGYFLVRPIDVNGNAIQLRLQGNPVVLSASGVDMEFSQAATSNPIMRHYGRNMGLSIGSGRFRVVTYNDDVWQAISASEFNVGSDRRLKSNLAPAEGALEALQAVPVYDYDMKGALPRKSLPEPATARVRRQEGGLEDGQVDDQRVVKAERARGVMADDLQKVLPDAVNEDEDGRLTVNLYHLLATTVAGLQELAAEVATLKAAQSPRK